MTRLIFLLILFCFFVYVASPFVLPLALAALITVLFFPWLRYLENHNWPKGAASAILTAGITVILLVPMGFFIFTAARKGLGLLRGLAKESGSTEIKASSFEELLNSPAVETLFEKINVWVPVDQDEALTAARDILTSIGIAIADGLRDFLTSLPSIFLGFAVVAVSIYFFFLDGQKLIRFIKKHSIFTVRQTERLVSNISVMSRSVVLASVISASTQAAIFAIAMVTMGVGNLALITFLVFLFSFIPLVGSMPITFSVALYQLLIGQTGVGITLLVFGVIVTVMDNFIRPIVIKGAADMHPLIAFIAAFGGIQMLGLPGVFFGPIIAGIFLCTLEIMVEPRR